MPKYSYTARDTSGVALTGELVAPSATEAVRLLRGEGKFVVGLDEAKQQDESALPNLAPRSRKVRSDEVVYFANQLAGMVDTGVPIADALEATIDHAPPGAFRNTIEDVIQRVQGGAEFSAALAAHPKVFSSLFVNMVRASEATGTLGGVLARIADYLVEQREIRKKIKGALVYPACMLLFAIGSTIFLLTYVLPKFTAIYASKRAILPIPTRALMAVSDWMVGYWPWLTAGLIAAGVGLTWFLRSPRGGWIADWVRLNIPLLGPMFRKACLARSLRTLGSMISAGVSVLEAVHITRDVVGNRHFARVFDNVHRRLEEGEQLSQALLDAPFFPRPIWQMLNAGERTGQLGPAMERVADLCEADLRHTIRTATQFIEPGMIVIMGIVIGSIALALLLPIFQISRVMAQ